MVWGLRQIASNKLHFLYPSGKQPAGRVAYSRCIHRHFHWHLLEHDAFRHARVSRATNFVHLVVFSALFVLFLIFLHDTFACQQTADLLWSCPKFSCNHLPPMSICLAFSSDVASHYASTGTAPAYSYRAEIIMSWEPWLIYSRSKIILGERQTSLMQTTRAANKQNGKGGEKRELMCHAEHISWRKRGVFLFFLYTEGFKVATVPLWINTGYGCRMAVSIFGSQG